MEYKGNEKGSLHPYQLDYIKRFDVGDPCNLDEKYVKYHFKFLFFLKSHKKRGVTKWM